MVAVSKSSGFQGKFLSAASSSWVNVPLNMYTPVAMRLRSLMAGMTPPSEATPNNMGANKLLKALLAVRDTREGMWKKMLAPEGSEKHIDFKLIARNFAISGGLIKGASIRAKAWSIGMNKKLSTPFVLASLARELEKNNRSTNEVFTREHREIVEALLDGDEEMLDDLIDIS